MVSKRNRTIELIEYLKSCGIIVNIGVNKARGNKGYFKASNKNYRIDIAKNLDEEEVINTLVHEFIHYVHYTYDKSLKSLDFIFDTYKYNAEEDLIALTVDSISKDSAKELYDTKSFYEDKINSLYTELKGKYPDIKKNAAYKKLEKSILKTDLKYLLKYDKVKIKNVFLTKILTSDNIKEIYSDVNDEIIAYIKLRQNNRYLNRLKSKISRLNRYYNSKTELLARSFEYYIAKSDKMQKITPNLYNYYTEIINNDKISILSNAIKILCNC